MNSRLMSVLFLVATVVCLTATESIAQGRGRNGLNAARFGWQFNYRSALDEARRTGRPIMLVFRCVP